MERMRTTPVPIVEKLTLFWHNHFATSNAKVRNARYMLDQYALLRKHALGSFAKMLQGMSAGAGGSESARTGIATEVDQIRDSLIGIANTRYIDRPVFGGTTDGGSAYDRSGSYVGDSGTVTRTVAEGTKVRVDSSGEDIFGTGSNQVFSVLADISDHLQNDPSQLSNDLDRLDSAMKGIQNAQASVGARTNRVEALQQTANERQVDLQTQLTEVEDIDLPRTITDMTLQQTAYQAALGATAKVIQPSLMDFLR
jgi:flagellar hook-associated protein 3 FlgL